MKYSGIKKEVENTICNIKQFGFWQGGIHSILKIVCYHRKKLKRKYIKSVYSYLHSFLKEDIILFNNDTRHAEESPSNNIWVCWWQGFDKMPDFCKMCYKRLQSNICGDFHLNFITKDNYADYVKIPNYIIDRLENGHLSITQFSDILREALLYYHGGLWIDATVWTNPNFMSSVRTDLEFWSIKLDGVVKKNVVGQIITQCQWAGFIMYGKRGNCVCKFALESMCKYYQSHEITIDYFIQNFIIRIGYDNISSIKEAIDRIPSNNKNLYSLSLVIDKEYNENEWCDICQETYFYKLTHKRPYLETINGKKTYYKKIGEMTQMNI